MPALIKLICVTGCKTWLKLPACLPNLLNIINSAEVTKLAGRKKSSPQCSGVCSMAPGQAGLGQVRQCLQIPAVSCHTAVNPQAVHGYTILGNRCQQVTALIGHTAKCCSSKLWPACIARQSRIQPREGSRSEIRVRRQAQEPVVFNCAARAF